jgi:hypothetical protein
MNGIKVVTSLPISPSPFHGEGFTLKGFTLKGTEGEVSKNINSVN